MTCGVCDGTGWMTYPHPNGEGGLGPAVAPCPQCIEDGLCPQCGRATIPMGAIQVCVCGFIFDEAAVPPVDVTIRY